MGEGLHLHTALFLHIQHDKHTMLPTAQMGTCCLPAWEVSADCLLPPVLSTDPWLGGCLLVPLAVPTRRRLPQPCPLQRTYRERWEVGGVPPGSVLRDQPCLKGTSNTGSCHLLSLMLQSTCLSETVSWHALACLLSATHRQIQEVLCGPQCLEGASHHSMPTHT